MSLERRTQLNCPKTLSIYVSLVISRCRTWLRAAREERCGGGVTGVGGAGPATSLPGADPEQSARGRRRKSRGRSQNHGKMSAKVLRSAEPWTPVPAATPDQQ